MAPSRSIRRPLRRFAQVDGRRRALVIEAVLCLALARLGLLALPFPALARRLGTLNAPRDAQAVATARPEAADVARDVSWAVTRAARHLPFGAVCLPQALAARQMLQRRGVASVLHFGAIEGGAAIKAHAWLDAAGIDVTGYPLPSGCTEIAGFV
jgi:hypothetical protein